MDYLTHPGRSLPDGVEAQRFEVVVNLLSLSLRQRVRIRVQVPESDPVVPSLVEPNAEQRAGDDGELLQCRLFPAWPDD